MAAGKPISELESKIASKLADYIADPMVNVKLVQNSGNTIFVIGKVTKPGQFPANRRIDVLQALSLAGGLGVFADHNSINVLRRVGNEVKVFPFNYDDVIDGEHLEQNILLEAGDTVTVP
jgi:polysaccharide export outer membrane protein